MMTDKVNVAVTAMFCACALLAQAQDVPFVLFPFREAVVASALDSELEEYCYKIGEPFTNGAVIARLDDSRYRIANQRACEHRDFTAQIAAEQAELRAKDFASEMELRKARYEAKLAEADYAETELNLRRCLLVAPFNGKIADMQAQRYETVKPGQPLFRIIQDDRLLAVANLPLGNVKVGDSVTLSVESALSATGTVYEVSPQADNRTGTVRVRILVDNAEGRFSAGMTGMLGSGIPGSADDSAPAENESDGAAPVLELGDPGVPYADVGEVFSGMSSRMLTVTNDLERSLVASNLPAAWRDCEVQSRMVSDTSMEILALPPVAITGLRYEQGMLAYSLHRFPRSVSLTSLKRLGTLVAGIYDEQGNRIACIEPKQVELPGNDQTIQGVVVFPQQDVSQPKAGKPAKLVVIVENDVRALNLKASGDGDE